MLKNHLFWDLSKALLSVVIISSIAIAIAMGIATAHDPSEMGGGAHTHQLPPPWPYQAMKLLVLTLLGFYKGQKNSITSISSVSNIPNIL
jgi:hypothetical protein